MARRPCCYLDCDKEATYELWDRISSPYDYTEACVDHVGALLIDITVTAVWKIDRAESIENLIQAKETS